MGVISKWVGEITGTESAKRQQARMIEQADKKTAQAEQDAAMGAGAEMMKRKKTARQSSLLSSTDPLSGAKKTLLGE